MRRTGWLVLAAIASLGCARGRVESGVVPGPLEALRIAEQLLAHGAAAWNGGDLDAFVSDYADGATFVTQRGVVTGRAAIRALYAPRFAPGASRGSLTFEGVQAFVLAPLTLHVVAYYVLTGLPSGTQRGPTSLILVREPSGRWRIAHDHSS